MAVEQTLKDHIKVSGTDEDDLIQAYSESVVAYVQGVTGKTYDAAKPVWKDVVRLFVARRYSHRGDNLPASIAKEDPAIEMLINHIAMCGDYV